MNQQQTPQKSASTAAIKDATSPIVEALQKQQWNRFLRLTRDVSKTRGAKPEERALVLLLRCQAARALHDRQEFERNAAAFRKDLERMPPQGRASFTMLVQSGKAAITYQDSRYRPRPVAVMPSADLKQRGLDLKALETLRRTARENVTDGLYLWHDGKVVLEDHFGAPQEPQVLMSVTKPIVAMAIGRLLDSGTLKSLDQTASDFFPEWKTDANKSRITLRHLLTHTAGLDNGEDLSESAQADMSEAARSDTVAFGRKIRSVAAPGERWIYSNLAFVLLGDIVKQASGKRLDAFMGDEFFAPMGITEWDWMTDRAGNVEAHGHLSLRAHDAAKFGVLMLDSGVWKGKRLLSDAFVRESLRDQTQKDGVRIKEAPTMGLAWFLQTRDRNPKVVFGDRTLQEWKKLEVAPAKIAKMLPYKGKVMTQTEFDALTGRLYGVKNLRDGEGWSRALGIIHYPVVAERVPAKAEDSITASFHHSGTGGQYLVCLRERRFVAVRQTTPKDLSDVGKDSTYLSFISDAAAVADKRIFASDELLLE
jgi:CubicO group peptidase (beta-lactamase class C family)